MHQTDGLRGRTNLNEHEKNNIFTRNLHKGLIFRLSPLSDKSYEFYLFIEVSLAQLGSRNAQCAVYSDFFSFPTV